MATRRAGIKDMTIACGTRGLTGFAVTDARMTDRRAGQRSDETDGLTCRSSCRAAVSMSMALAERHRETHISLSVQSARGACAGEWRRGGAFSEQWQNCSLPLR